ncbi:MAG: ABC transporter substrate-binding protein [Gammaproteobacteria bacterium]|nr:ABC transporter substrate-binding protein [Gammaproteobacteria bacterium]
MKKIYSVLKLLSLSGLIVFTVTACFSNKDNTGNDNTVNKNEDKIIRFGIYNVAVTLDPRYATDAISSRINRLIYQRLVNFDKNTLAIAAIATWKQITPKHFQFNLVGSPKFHHGKPLSMIDVKSTYDDILYNKNKVSPHRNTLQHIESIKLIDNKTLDFHLSREDSLFPTLLIHGILPDDLLKKSHPFNIKPIGSGEFEFLSWPNDSKIILKRLSDNQQFEFHSVKDPTVRILKLIKGEVDLIQNNLPSEQIRFLKLYEGLNYNQIEGSNYAYIGINHQDKILSNLKIRQAIAMAIDRDKIIQFVLGNAAIKANGFFPDFHWLSGETIKQLDYNPKKAMEIMQSLGFSLEKPLKLTFKTSSNPFSIRKAAVFQAQLAKVGIQLEIKSYDWGTFYGDIKSGKFQLYSLEWVGVKTPDIYRYVFHSESVPPKGANRGRLIDKIVDELIEKAEKSQQLSSKEALYSELQRVLTEKLAYISLWYQSNIVFYHNNISGYEIANDGSYDGLKTIQKQ